MGGEAAASRRSIGSTPPLVDVQMLLGRDNEALATALKSMEIDPAFPQMLGALSQVFSRLGRHSEAIAAAKKASELAGTTEQTATLACAHAAAGDRATAERILRELEARVTREAGDPYQLTGVYVSLRGDPRFVDLVRSLGIR